MKIDVEPVQGRGEILDCGPLTPAAAAAEALDEHAFEEYGMQVQWPAIAASIAKIIEDLEVIDHMENSWILTFPILPSPLQAQDELSQESGAMLILDHFMITQ